MSKTVPRRTGRPIALLWLLLILTASSPSLSKSSRAQTVTVILLQPAEVTMAPGETAEIITPAGRRLRGTLAAVNPAYTHGFGAPLPELSGIGGEVRAMLRERGIIK